MPIFPLDGRQCCWQIASFGRNSGCLRSLLLDQQAAKFAQHNKLNEKKPVQEMKAEDSSYKAYASLRKPFERKPFSENYNLIFF